MTDTTTPPASHPSAEERARRGPWIALCVLCAGMLMIVLDVTIVNVALPSIQSDLGFSQANLAWLVNAYLVAFGGLLLLAGRLGDLCGHRAVFLWGLAVFTAASLACGLAHSQAMLVTARFVQGAGGAMTSAVILGMIVTMFPEPREQAKALGVYGFVASAGGSIGLLAGGLLTQSVSWHWIFFVNVPIGLATAVLARRHLEAGPGAGLRRGADAPGAARLGARPTLLAGLTLAVAGLVLFAQAPAGGGYTLHVLPVMLLLAIGIGGSFPALMALSMAGVAPEDAGLASGLVNTSAQVGGALGLAVLASVSAARSGALLRAGESQAAALTGGYHLAFLVAAALMVAAIAVAALTLAPPAAADDPALEDLTVCDAAA